MVMSAGLASSQKTRDREQLSFGPRSHGVADWSNRTLVGRAGEPAASSARDGWGWGKYVACGTADGHADGTGLALGAGVEVADGVGSLVAGEESAEGLGAIA